jgi:hypothetical protein
VDALVVTRRPNCSDNFAFRLSDVRMPQAWGTTKEPDENTATEQQAQSDSENM